MTLIRDGIALLPCPFCGGTAELASRPVAFLRSRAIAVRCSSCGASSPEFTQEADPHAIAERWNQRVPTWIGRPAQPAPVQDTPGCGCTEMST